MIKNNFAVLLAERGFRVADAVRATGISKTNLHKLYKNDSKRIDLDTVDKICEYLDVGVGDLFEYVPNDKAEVTTGKSDQV